MPLCECLWGHGVRKLADFWIGQLSMGSGYGDMHRVWYFVEKDGDEKNMGKRVKSWVHPRVRSVDGVGLCKATFNGCKNL